MSTSSRFAGLRIRTLIWLFFIGGSGVVPFATIYYRSIFSNGPDDSAIGIITTLLVLQPLLSILSNPFAGFIADRFKIEHRMIVICGIFTAAGAALIALPGLGLIAGLTIGTKLLLMGAGIIVLGLFSGPIFPMINAEAFNLIEKNREPEGSYGRYRVHGSLSWVVFTILIGILLTLTQFLPLIFIAYAAGFLLLSLVALTGIRTEIKPVKLPFAFLRKDVRFRRIIIFNFLHSFSLFGSLYFTGLFLVDEHIGFFLIGLAFALSALLEIPVLFLGPRLTARFGNRFLIVTGTVVLTAKLFFLGFAALSAQAWLILPIMFIHGIGFPMQFLGMMNIINGLAHPDLRATYLNLYTTIGVNIPWALGILFFAWIIDVIGSTSMMLIAGGIGALSLLYFIIFVPRAVSHRQSMRQAKKG